MNHHKFFTTEVPQCLNQLHAQTPNLWGTMNAAQMLDHLLAGTLLMLSEADVEVTIPEEKLARYKTFLVSDQNFMESAPKPALYNDYEGKHGGDINQLKTAFLEALVQFDKHTSTDEKFSCTHPSFGNLNAEETRQLQYKHIRHHFQQFGLMPR